MAGLVGQVDVGRNGWIGGPFQLGENRSQFRPASRGRISSAPAYVAGHALVGGVRILCSNHGPHQHQLVHDPGQPRQVLADMDSRDFGLDGLKLTADLRGGVGLDFVHVLVRRAAGHVNHDDGFAGLAQAGLLFRPEQLGQGQSTHSQRADLDKVSPRHPVAHAVALPVDGQHFSQPPPDDCLIQPIEYGAR